MMRTTHKVTKPQTEDQRQGNEMAAVEDAALMIGFALGRRIGGAR
jgi:hypothetical protein